MTRLYSRAGIEAEIPMHLRLYKDEATRDRGSLQLDTQARDRALHAVFGRNSAVPPVDGRSLRTYYRHLAERLAFPFRALYYQETAPMETTAHHVQVIGLLDPLEHPMDERTGLMCRAVKGFEEFEMPLAELVIEEEGRNQQLVEDYWYWFWNWQ